MLDTGRRLGTQHEFSISLQTTQPPLPRSLLIKGITPGQAPKQGTGTILSPPSAPTAHPVSFTPLSSYYRFPLAPTHPTALQPALSPSACDRGAAPTSLPPLAFFLVLPPPADETSLTWRCDHYSLLHTVTKTLEIRGTCCRQSSYLQENAEPQEFDFKGL